MKKIKILVLASLSMLGVSNMAYADITHGDAHTKTGAASVLAKWKSNSTLENDPFRRVSLGYAEEKNEQDNEVFESNKVIYNAYLTDAASFTSSNIDIRKMERDELVGSAYQSSLNSETGEIDYNRYSSQLNAYQADRETLSGIHYEERQNRLSAVSIDKYGSLANVNSTVSTESLNATYNIIQLMDQDLADKKSAVLTKFNDNINSQNSANSAKTSALSLATTFDNSCPACAFVSEPVIVEPEPEPEPPEESPPTYNPINECEGYGRTYKSGTGFIYRYCP
jgi:hypothetical protein